MMKLNDKQKCSLLSTLYNFFSIYLQIAPLLMIRPSSALHLPQLLPGSGAHPSPEPFPPDPAPVTPVVTLVTPLLRKVASSDLSRLELTNNVNKIFFK